MNRREAVSLVAAGAAFGPLGLRTAWGAPSVDARTFGLAVGASPAANAAALRRCLSESAGRAIVQIPGMGAEYQLAGKITAPARTSIVLADGARLKWVATEPTGTEFLGAPTRPGIEVAGDEFALAGDGSLVGPTEGTYLANEIGILAIGESAAALRKGFFVGNGVRLSGWGSRAIAAQFVSDVRVIATVIGHCGYGGMQFLSCHTGQIRGNVVESIGPGASGNAYGISCTHDSRSYAQDPNALANGRLAANPFCSDFVIEQNTVQDIPLWTGIDFHGAYDCRVEANKVYNCRNGILVQGSSGPAVEFAGSNNTVVGNMVTTGRSDGGPTTITEITRLGISVNGGRLVHHRSISVIDNSIEGYGDSRHTSFSLQHTYTSDVSIRGNRVTAWSGYGCYSAYSDGTVADNVFGPVADPAGTACIYVAVGGNLRLIGNRQDASGEGRAMYGIVINTPASSRCVIENNDFSAATARAYAGHAGGILPRQFFSGANR